MITIPSLSNVTDILDTDQVMVTNAQGQSYKIAGSELNKRHKVIIADSTTVTGTPLKEGWTVRICFTVDITAANATTTMQINYNNVNYYVKVPKNGALANYVAFNLGGSPAVFKYVQAYTTLELLFDGTQFIIMCNPVVISGTNFSIYADGLKRVDEVTENGTDLVTSHAVAAAIDKVKDIMGALPTDAVLHYSFDEVPDYPDGTAVYFRNQDFSLSDGWAGGSNVFTVPNGILTVADVATTYIYKPISITNPIVRCKIRTSVDDTINLYGNEPGSVQHTIATVNAKANEVIEIVGNINITLSAIGITGFDLGTKFEVLSFYIGDGSYSTPIIDNANGERNSVSQSGVAVQGVSGKGFNFPSANQQVLMDYRAPTSNDNFTISFWLKVSTDYDVSGTAVKSIVSIGQFTGLFGFCRAQGVIQFIARDSNGSKTLSANIDKGKWHLYSAVFNGTTHTFDLFVDGVKLGTSAVLSADYQFGSNIASWKIWGNNTIQGISDSVTNQSAIIDDLLIFDRALSDTEVMALYLNKANTPKYYPPAQLPS